MTKSKTKNWVSVIILIIFVLILFLISFLFFLRLPLTGDIPQEMKDAANELKENSDSKLDLARNTYNFVDNKFTSPIREYLQQPGKIFLKDRQKIWEINNQYAQSGTQNEMFKELLILTKEFEKEDFKLIQSFCTHSPHTYWELKIDNKIIFIDLWFEDNSLQETVFGCYAKYSCQSDDIVCSEGFP